MGIIILNKFLKMQNLKQNLFTVNPNQGNRNTFAAKPNQMNAITNKMVAPMSSGPAPKMSMSLGSNSKMAPAPKLYNTSISGASQKIAAPKQTMSMNSSSKVAMSMSIPSGKKEFNGPSFIQSSLNQMKSF